MVKTFIKAVMAFAFSVIFSSVFSQVVNPPTILCGEIRAAQNNGGCGNALGRAYDAAGNPTQYLIGEVRRIDTAQSGYNYGGQYNTGYTSTWVPPVIVNAPPAIYGSGYHHHQRRQVVLCDGWNEPCPQAPQVVVVRQPVLVAPPCQRISKNPGEWVVGTVVSGVIGLAVGQGAGLAYRGLTGRDGNYEKRGRQTFGGLGFVAGAADTDKWDCSERDALIRAQEEARLAAQPVPSIQQGVIGQVRNRCAHVPGTEPAVVINENVIDPATGLSRLNDTVCARRGDTNVRFPN